MKKSLLILTAMGMLLITAACDFSSSRVFDNNCSGNAMIENPAYCTGSFHANAGPYAAK